MRRNLTYANVTSSLALVIAVGGAGAFAATQLAKNSVGSKQIRKNAITAAKIRTNAVTGAKVKDHSLTGNDIDLAKLGTVPQAHVADSANALAPVEGIHMVGAPGEPQFENGSTNFGSEGPNTFSSVGFYRDHDGIVHLEGMAKVDAGPGFVSVFTLPPGYRPGPLGVTRKFEQINELITIVGADGRVQAREKGAAAFEGITFRAES
jgi:hypothetical protein